MHASLFLFLGPPLPPLPLFLLELLSSGQRFTSDAHDRRGPPPLPRFIDRFRRLVIVPYRIGQIIARARASNLDSRRTDPGIYRVSARGRAWHANREKDLKIDRRSIGASAFSGQVARWRNVVGNNFVLMGRHSIGGNCSSSAKRVGFARSRGSNGTGPTRRTNGIN